MKIQKLRCNVCGAELNPRKEDLYHIPQLALMKAAPEYKECMDCPKCGCQNVLNTRYGKPPEGEGGGTIKLEKGSGT